MSGLIDPSTLTIEQLTELLNKKNTTSTPPVSTGSKKESLDEKSKKCSFKPTRTNQVVCDQDAEIFFGSQGYCFRHRRSVQALNAKKNADTNASVGVSVGATSVQTVLPVATPTEAGTPASSEAPPEVEKKSPANGKAKKVTKTSKGTTETPKGASDGKSKTTSKATTPTPTPTPAAVQGTTIKKSEPPKKIEPKPIIKKKITPNTWGRFEDPDTNIVFDPKTKMAYGVQDHVTGKVVSLSKRHIALCDKYKWKYHVLPETTESCEDCGHEIEECICEVLEEVSDEVEDEVDEEVEDEVEDEVEGVSDEEAEEEVSDEDEVEDEVDDEDEVDEDSEEVEDEVEDDE